MGKCSRISLDRETNYAMGEETISTQVEPSTPIQGQQAIQEQCQAPKKEIHKTLYGMTQALPL